MAQNQSPAFFAVAILLLAAAAPLAIAQPPPALPIGGGLPIVGPVLNALNINGTLCCTPTGICPGGPPLVGVPVTLVCNVLGVNVNVGQAVTNLNGSFAITIGNLLSTVLAPIPAVLGGNIPCAIKVDVSGVACPVINLTNSLLNVVLRIIGIAGSTINGLVGMVSLSSNVGASV